MKEHDYYLAKIKNGNEGVKGLHATFASRRSVTPDTHISRVLVEDDDDLTKAYGAEIPQVESEEPLYYVDRYKYQDNYVLHLGISPKSAFTKLDTKDLITESAQSSIPSTLKPDLLNKIVHHDIEKELIKKAIPYLLSDDCSSKCVLIDIFDRHISESGSPIKKNTISDPQNSTQLISAIKTHSVVLYWDQNKTVSVIDPSNHNFSCHLKKLSNDLESDFGIKLDCTFKGQIYTPKSNAGIGPEQAHSRDCVDIAIKIAFCIQYLNTIGEFDINTIKKLITNNDKLNSDIFYTKIADGADPRIKQSSDIQQVIEFNKKIEECNKEYLKTQAECKTQIKKLETKHSEVLKDFAKDLFQSLDSSEAMPSLDTNSIPQLIFEEAKELIGDT